MKTYAIYNSEKIKLVISTEDILQVKANLSTDDKFKEAEQKIADAQEEIDAIADPEWYVFDRSDNPGYSTFAQNVERLGAVASVFPMFFLLVAVLV